LFKMYHFLNGPAEGDSAETGDHVESCVMGRSRGFIFVMRQALGRLLVILAFLVLPQIGGPAAEAGVDLATTTEVVQPPISQLAPSTELRDKTTGGSTVKVQSLEDVMKVLTSSLPNRLEAGIQRPTAAEAERYGLRPNQGVVIGWLDPKGPLGRAGLNMGDIIVQVDNRPIEGLEDFVSLVDSLEMRQAATFSVLDHRTRSLKNVRIVVGENQRLQETRGSFLSRHMGTAVSGIKKAAQSLKQGFDNVAEMGKGAFTTVIQGLKKWASKTEEEPLVSAEKGH